MILCGCKRWYSIPKDMKKTLEERNINPECRSSLKVDSSWNNFFHLMTVEHHTLVGVWSGCNYWTSSRLCLSFACRQNFKPQLTVVSSLPKGMHWEEAPRSWPLKPQTLSCWPLDHRIPWCPCRISPLVKKLDLHCLIVRSDLSIMMATAAANVTVHQPYRYKPK